MRLNDYTLSRHLVAERQDRIFEILTTTGFGEIIKKEYYENKVECITSTGVLLSMSKDEKTIITLFRVNMNKCKALYKDEKIPASLKKIIIKYEKNA